MKYLFDVNALIALAWPPQSQHQQMQQWLHVHGMEGWATCALTQAGFIRIVTQPAFATLHHLNLIKVSHATSLLQTNIAHKKHQFLDLNFGFDKVLSTCTGGLQGHRQVTDAYLLTLAIQNKRQLVTFDAGIGSLLATTTERQKHLLVLS
jgi:uncharacterized protein